MLRALIYTTLFPNAAQPVHGNFIVERMRHVLPFVDMTVVAPVPYFPRVKLNHRWATFAEAPRTERIAGFEVDHPRYVVVPRIGMTTHGVSMFAGSLPQVWRRLRSTDFDLIDAHYIYPDGLAAIMLGAFLKKPVVVSARGSDINLFPKFKAIRVLVQQVLKRADAVIAVSQSLKNVMVDLGCEEEKITVIRNGVDPQKFKLEPQAAAREKLGLPPSPPLILSIGVLTDNKGFRILIDAIARLRRHQPDAVLVIIGEGEDRRRLENQIRRLGLEKNVLLAVAYPNAELGSWYNAADVFCLASEIEGCPNVLLEAMACGCPVISTDGGGGIREIVTDPSLGMVVERTPEAFESAIDNALVHQWDREAIAVHGQSHCWEQAAASILNVYSQVVDRYKR